MTVQNQINTLLERAKELDCLYKTSEILKDSEADLSTIIHKLTGSIAAGWRFPETIRVKITVGDTCSASVHDEDFSLSNWVQTASYQVDEDVSCVIQVSYPNWDALESPFLAEEQRLLNSITERLCAFLQRRRLLRVNATQQSDALLRTDWKIIMELIYKSDPDQYLRIARKMMNYLSGLGVEDARKLLSTFGEQKNRKTLETVYDTNRPFHREHKSTVNKLIQRAFVIADKHLDNAEIYSLLQTWLKGDKISFLVQALENLSFSLNTIQDALHRFHNLSLEGIELPKPTLDNITVLLLLRFFTEQLEFIKIAKPFVDIEDFVELVRNIVFPTNSYGKLGGKSAGLFLSYNILKRVKDKGLKLDNIKIPKTRYLLSDALHQFLNFNELNELIEQKYKTIEQIRDEYPNIVQVFKNSNFPPNIISGLALVLDEFGEKPIIVRSSSLLEDRVGAAFSGKYKSLFLANQGSKKERLYALLDAIAEVYASTFGPDPVEYRKERGLLDFHEEMAIIIQEVVGSKVGDYWLPSFAGVAFSNNEFRWSPRIQRENGLVRLVPGLGTRAVDRVSDDFPILVSPGQPNLRVNLSNDEILRYSPRKVDVINLKSNTFETIDFAGLFKQFGAEYPIIEQVASVYCDRNIITKSAFNLEFDADKAVVTFEGLITKTNFMPRIKSILDTLKTAMGVSVDIEFAFDGKDLYILQCRAQSTAPEYRAANIPKDIPEKDVLFTAGKYVSNGLIPDISHIVLVEPDEYSALKTVEEMKTVGRIVGKLNKILPKHKFILMGPGRWGSRGDVKLGVSITYSDINNTAMLIEIARKKGNYTPDLSFGTHFFQDLVESGIRYLPLYPDEKDNVFNHNFLNKADNILMELITESTDYSKVIKVIDVEKSVPGKTVTIRMNGDLDEAIAYFSGTSSKEVSFADIDDSTPYTEKHWIWRLRMAEHIASCLDKKKYGVKAMYIFGSVKNGNAGAGSDLDLLVHIETNSVKRKLLSEWFDGWSKCLAELNFLKTGYRTDGLLDIHYITDKDIAAKTSYAAKINAVTDAARLLITK
jgi:pyruvate,water dikinase